MTYWREAMAQPLAAELNQPREELAWLELIAWVVQLHTSRGHARPLVDKLIPAHEKY
jgi:hypothetical protein